MRSTNHADLASRLRQPVRAIGHISLRASRGLEQRAFSWLLALFLAVFAVYPALMHPIEEYAHDAAMFRVHRGVVFSAARTEGWLFPRWAPGINAGLGGPLFSFHAPMLYSLMDVLARLGIGHPLAYRLVTALALLAGAAGMFGLALRLFRRADVAWACTVAFTYAPHLLKDLFERGSPQGLAVVLYPWALWALLRLAERPSGGPLLLASLCWAMTLLLHTGAALWLLPVIGLFLIPWSGYDYLARRSGRVSLPLCLVALLAGALLAAFFLVPFVGERHYVQHERSAEATRPDLNPVGVADLLALPAILDTGLGNNGMGFGIGLLHAPLFIVGLLVGAILWRRGRARDMILPAGAAGLGLATIWLQTAGATLVWAALPALNSLQFRWRLQSTIGLLAALVLGSWLTLFAGRWRSVAVACLVVAHVGLSLPSLYPQLLPQRIAFPPALTLPEVQSATLRLGVPTLSAFGEELPIWRRLPFTEGEARMVAARPIANLPAGSRVIRDERRTGQWHIQVETPSAFEAALHVLYYPGWVGYVNGRRQPLSPMEGAGYAQLAIPPGSHEIILRYEGTITQRLGDWLSVSTLIGLLLLAVIWRGERRVGAAESIAYPRARWWLPVGLLLLAGLKAFWIDPHTTWLRRASSCAAIHGAQVQTSARFGEGLRLCGYSVSRREVHPGDRLRVTLYWQSDRPLERQAAVFVHLVGRVTNPAVGYPIWGQGDKQVPGEIQLVHWVPGKLYPDTYDFQIPAHTPEGDYQLAIGWWDPETGQRLPLALLRPQEGLAVGEWEDLVLAGFTVRRSAWQRLSQWVQREVLTRRIQHRHEETLGGVVRFLGYDLERATVRPGEAVRLRLYWEALGVVPGDYKVFTHLLDGQGHRWAGHDGIPVEGMRPTAGWAVGELLVDRREIVVPQEAPPGRYRLQVGLYDWQSGLRLPAHDAAGNRLEEDRILLGAVTIE